MSPLLNLYQAAPRYSEGAFQYSSGAEASGEFYFVPMQCRCDLCFEEVYKRIPTDTDILLTHTPPYKVHDRTRRGKHAGCKHLADRLQQLELGSYILDAPSTEGDQTAVQMETWNCRLHVFGHIHEAYGASVKTGPTGECVRVNAAVPSSGKPIVVDLHVRDKIQRG